MSYPIKNSNWNVQYDGKITFFGVLYKYYDVMGDRYGLNPDTRLQYARQYEKYILPHVSDKSLEEYTAEEFESIIERHKSGEKQWAKQTLQHFRQLISRVIDIAVEEEGLRNPLWGVEFEEVLTPLQVEKKERKLLPKSFTIKQHIILSKLYFYIEQMR